VFSAILLTFGREWGWDQLLYVITELPANFLRPVPRFEPLCMGACSSRPPLCTIWEVHVWAVQVFMSHDSSCIEIEVYNNGKTHRLVKLLFFIYKCAGILLTSIYITQLMLATPTLIGT